jgi:hypothetical protein
MPSADASRSGEADATPHRTTLKVSSCQAYESLLMAALRSQVSQRVYRQWRGRGWQRGEGLGIALGVLQLSSAGHSCTQYSVG